MTLPGILLKPATCPLALIAVPRLLVPPSVPRSTMLPPPASVPVQRNACSTLVADQLQPATWPLALIAVPTPTFVLVPIVPRFRMIGPADNERVKANPKTTATKAVDARAIPLMSSSLA